MRHLRTAFTVFALLFLTSMPGLCGGTPESTLEEIVFTDKVDVVIQHLPESIGQAWKDLSPKEKAEAAEELLISKRMKKEGITLKKNGVDQWDAEDDKGEVKGHARLKNSFVSGLDALVVLELSEARDENTDHSEHAEHKALAFISMQLQDGEWRLTQLGGGEQHNIEEILHFGPNPTNGEAYAVGSLRTLNTAIITYQSTYPDAGLPADIKTLGGTEEPSAEHAGLIDQALASGTKSGYQFHYTHSGSTYTITARPVEFGKTGTRSFFTDETGVIRFTSEDREPNSGDEAL